jgi:hypothetical protein
MVYSVTEAIKAQRLHQKSSSLRVTLKLCYAYVKRVAVRHTVMARMQSLKNWIWIFYSIKVPTICPNAIPPSLGGIALDMIAVGNLSNTNPKSTLF